MNENKMLLMLVLLSLVLAIPVVFAEVFAPQNSSQSPLTQKEANEVVKNNSPANQAIKTQQELIKAESEKAKTAVDKNKDRFISTETISEDLSVSFPTDI